MVTIDIRVRDRFDDCRGRHLDVEKCVVRCLMSEFPFPVTVRLKFIKSSEHWFAGVRFYITADVDCSGGSAYKAALRTIAEACVRRTVCFLETTKEQAVVYVLRLVLRELSIDDCAFTVGVSERTVRKWLSGDCQPSAASVVKLNKLVRSLELDHRVQL